MDRSAPVDRTPLRITVAQPPTEPRDVVVNARTHAAVVGASGGGVVVFPELSLTGYHLDVPALDPVGDPPIPPHVVSPIVEACRRAGAVALVGVPTRSPGPGGGDHISVLAIDGEGARVVYHKWFLGGDEAGRFAPGSGPAVLEVGGWRLGLAVCRDTGVAEHASATAGRGIDVYAAGVCEHGSDRAVVAARARRIATGHRVWVAMASFAGPTGEGYDVTAGGSGIWGPDGAVVARSGPGPGETATAVLGPGRPGPAGRRDGSPGPD